MKKIVQKVSTNANTSKVQKRKYSSLKQMYVLILKEFKQIIRDPSSYLVAFILPMIFLFFFGYAINLDAGVVDLALVNESDGQDSQQVALAFANSKHFRLHQYSSRQEASQALRDNKLQGIVVLPSDFDKRFSQLTQADNVPVQIMTDGASVNNANFVKLYSEAVLMQWQMTKLQDTGMVSRDFAPSISAETRFWYNDTAKSRWSLIPGSITIVMTMIGTLLTSLVITREWERGTMEAMLATPITRMQLLICKIVPYYVLGMMGMIFCTVIGVFLFKVPLRGSVFALFALSTCFLMPALGQGLLISSLCKQQLMAAIMAFLSGMLPAFILSGVIYDINSMPDLIQPITYIIAARYFNVCMQTLFLAGDLWYIFLPNMLILLGMGFFFFALVYKNLVKRID